MNKWKQQTLYYITEGERLRRLLQKVFGRSAWTEDPSQEEKILKKWQNYETKYKIKITSDNLKEMQRALKYREALKEYKPDVNHLRIIISMSEDEGVDPNLALAIISKESSFRENLVSRNRDGSNDYGYFQLNSKWHKQHRGSLKRHIQTALEFIKWCLKASSNNTRKALSRYNAGSENHPIGLRYADDVIRRRRDIENKYRSLKNEYFIS